MWNICHSTGNPWKLRDYVHCKSSKSARAFGSFQPARPLSGGAQTALCISFAHFIFKYHSAEIPLQHSSRSPVCCSAPITSEGEPKEELEQRLWCRGQLGVEGHGPFWKGKLSTVRIPRNWGRLGSLSVAQITEMPGLFCCQHPKEDGASMCARLQARLSLGFSFLWHWNL